MIAEAKITGWNYQTESVALVPYVRGKEGVFPEEFLVGMYFRLKSEKTLDLLFPGWNHEPDVVEFMSYFKDKPLMVGMVKADDPPWKIMGLGWLWDTEGPAGARKASCAYVFFRDFWGRDEVRKVARLALKYWFTECNIDIIFGAALKTNLRAQRFDREMGFRKDGELRKFFVKNGQLHDAVIVSMTRDEFIAAGG